MPEADVRVEAAGHGAVDDGLSLLVQQRHQPPLGADVASDATVGVVEEADDGGLFDEGRKGESVRTQLVARQMSDCALVAVRESTRLRGHH